MSERVNGRGHVVANGDQRGSFCGRLQIFYQRIDPGLRYTGWKRNRGGSAGGDKF